jgi:tetratricopeptide (TPR) repeat protein
LLYLAVRAARRAVALNPDDARPWLVLGESYLQLLYDTRERAWAQRMPRLRELRQAQASAALNQAITLKPDYAQAHFSLSRLYQELGFLDLTLHHLRTYLELTQKAQRPGDSQSESFREQQAQLERDVSQLNKEVQKRLDTFQVETLGAKVLDRAFKARQLGLAGKARDLLLESNIAAFGPRGMGLELDLMLRTGRARDVRDWTAELNPEYKDLLGASYWWLRTQALAALGDYALAQEECSQLSPMSAAGGEGRGLTQAREIVATLVGQMILVRPAMPHLLWRSLERIVFSPRIGGLVQAFRREADTTVLRGLLALEQGEVEEAEIAFREALVLWKDEASAAAGAGIDFNARAIAQGCLEWLEQVQPGGKRPQRLPAGDRP